MTEGPVEFDKFNIYNSDGVFGRDKLPALGRECLGDCDIKRVALYAVKRWGWNEKT